MTSHDHHSHRHDDLSVAAAVLRDPVCGMTIDPGAGKPQLAYANQVYYFCCEGCRAKFEATPEQYLSAKDPVCGMTVDRSRARHFLRRQGEKFYFCSAGCQSKFDAAPEDYLDGKRPAPAPMPEETQYTCPMHPEVV